MYVYTHISPAYCMHTQQIEQDMVLIFSNESDNVKRDFCVQWTKYITAILTFSDGRIGSHADLDPSSMCINISVSTTPVNV